MAYDTEMLVYAATVLSFAVLAGICCNRLALSVLRLVASGRAAPGPSALPDGDLPHVLVQLPMYNEPQVCARVIRAVAAFDWPHDRLHVQVLDDSTDETTPAVASLVRTLRREGLDIAHIRRVNRHGFKAGALSNGLAHDDSPFVAIFDADFVPPADFLRRALPTLVARPELAFVQTRWEHLNARESVLTAAQATILDAHFAVEQYARDRTGLFLPFNGSCGIWRRAAIEAAGGWSADTLCEDLDLSLRARLGGWSGSFRHDLAVPGELPTSLTGWRAQQFRWTKGFAQAARKLLLPVWRSRLSPRVRLALTLQLCEPLGYPFAAASLLGSIALAATGQNSRAAQLFGAGVALFGIAATGFFLALGRAVLRRGGWLRFPATFVVTLVLVTGLMISNMRAVVEALIGRASPFTRTPKRGADGRSLLWDTPRVTGAVELSFACVLGIALVCAVGWLSPLFSLSVVGLVVVGTGLARENRAATGRVPAALRIRRIGDRPLE